MYMTNIGESARRILLLSLIVFSTLFIAPKAHAHAQLTSSFPRAGAVIKTWPSQIWVEFDGDLIQIGNSHVNQLFLLDSKGKQITLKNVVVGGARVTASTVSTPTPGKVTIGWRVVSEDGHPVSNSIYFYYIPASKK
jgi:methionine-rich copper-binding protein CopC